MGWDCFGFDCFKQALVDFVLNLELSKGYVMSGTSLFCFVIGHWNYCWAVIVGHEH